jgi:hypothetical protein
MPDVCILSTLVPVVLLIISALYYHYQCNGFKCATNIAAVLLVLRVKEVVMIVLNGSGFIFCIMHISG